MKNKINITIYIFIIFVLLIFSSCDMGSYNPIAKALDPFEPLGKDSRSWLSISGEKGESVTRFIVLQQGVPSHRETGGYVLIEIRDSSFNSETDIKLIRGIYSIAPLTDRITFYPYTEFSGSYYRTSSPANFPDPIGKEGESYTLDYSYNSSDELSLGSPAVLFRPLFGSGGLINLVYTKDPSINSSDSDEVRSIQFMLLYQIGIYASQVIVPGFGGTGMMRYYNSETPFNGLIYGKEWILMSKLLPLARVDFTYQDMDNIAGMEMSGLLRTDSNAKGNGNMSETVSVHVDDSYTESGSFEAAVSYDSIELTGTIPSDGNYTVTIDGTETDVAYDNLIPGNLDYPGMFP